MGSSFDSLERVAAAIARGERRRLEQVRELVEQRERTATDITGSLSRGASSGAQRHFAMAETLAYLAFHEVRGMLERARRPDGVFVWRSSGDAGQQEVAR